MPYHVVASPRAGVNPELQPYKFGDKEYDEMHGLNWYDQGARPFGTIIPITPTMDPLAEKYYSMSPYSQWGNNPVRYVDPTGMWIVGLDDEPVFYDDETGWTSNASDDIIKIGEAMMRTPAGKEIFRQMESANHRITINYREGFHPERKDKLGEAAVYHNTTTNEVTRVEINLFDGMIKEDVSKINADFETLKNSNLAITTATEKDRLLRSTNTTLFERIGQVGVHEGAHATDPSAMYHRVGEIDAEHRADFLEMRAIRQTVQFNRPIPINPNTIKIR
jgi:RHS repeat-associated protein